MDDRLPVPKKRLLVACLVFTMIAALAAIGQRMGLVETRINFLQLNGLLLQLTGLIQLEVSGFFGCLIDRYSDEEKYPYGPPSVVTRTIMDNVDHPIILKVSALVFQDSQTGFYSIVAGTLLQIIDVLL